MAARPMVPVRLDEATIVALDEIAQVMSERAAGADISRSEAARRALDRGIPVLKAELGIAPTKTKAPRKR